MATVYINPTFTFNGDGTTPYPAASGGAAGARNAPVTTAIVNTTYSYARGTRTVLSATSITCGVAGVIFTAHGTGDRPIIDANGTASFALDISGSTNCQVMHLDLRNGSNANATLNIGAATTSPIIIDTAVSSVNGCVLINATATGGTIDQCTVTCGATNTIGVNHGGGAGWVIKNTTVTMTDPTKSAASTALIAIALRPASTSTTCDGCTTVGGIIGIEARSTDSTTIKNCTISSASVSGIRLRDSNSCTVECNEIYSITSGAGYPSGTGTGIDIIDIGTTAGNNLIRRNYVHDCYQGILDQSDNTGGNKITANLVASNITNGISYQSKGARGLIGNNSIYHRPYSVAGSTPVGHGIVVESTTTASTCDIVNNLVVLDGVTGEAVHGIALTNESACGNVYVNYNCYLVRGGGNLGGITSGSNYKTLPAWQDALEALLNITGCDAQSISTEPQWLAGPFNRPRNALDFCIQLASPLIGAGTWTQSYTDYRGVAFNTHKPNIGAFETGIGAPMPYAGVTYDAVNG